jgi:endonuclease G
MNPMKTYLTALFILWNICNALGQQEAITTDQKKVVLFEDGTWEYADSIAFYELQTKSISKLEIPKIGSKEFVINHTGYSLVYSEPHEQAIWVAYELTKEETIKKFERTDKFLIDPQVKTKTANDKDYSGTGFDRGHLAPASDMAWSSTSMAESFYYSNMSPQSPSFNRGIWKRLEELVRTWANDNNSVYVVTGPVLSSDLQTIGANKVSVPNYFYKVILDYNSPGIKAIGFIIPNTGSKALLQNYAVSIDSVEALTGLDFFTSIPDEQEEAIESNLCSKCWTWKSQKPDEEVSTSSGDRLSSSVQCNGNTQKGARCKNVTLNTSGYCYLHVSQENKSNTQVKPATSTQKRTSSVQCSGTTQAGNRCKRMTLSSNGRCYQHGG